MSDLPVPAKPRMLDPRPQMQPLILRLYSTPADLQAAVDSYFEANPEKPTWSGLALHVGLESRQQLWRYLSGDSSTFAQMEEGERSCWLLPLKRAASRIEEKHEARMFENQCAGSIFALKQRGWTDQQTVRHEGGGFILHVDTTAADRDTTGTE